LVVGNPRVLVIGPGSVGSLITYALNTSGVIPQVAFRSRPRSSLIRCPSGEVHGLRAELTPFEGLSGSWDVVFVTTKAYDAVGVIGRLRNLEFDLAVFTQNGLGVLERAEEVLGGDRVAQLVLNHGVYYDSSSGTFVWVGGGRSYLGMRRRFREVLRAVAQLLKPLSVEVVDDVEPYRWVKLVVNACINPITALLRVPNGYLLRSRELELAVRRVAEEVRAVASRLGIELPGDPVAEVFRVAESTAGNISSTLSDVLACRRTEVEFINGAVVELGRKLGIPTPYNEVLYYLVKSLEGVCGGV
jgi:2-dehydropantoate 2-reductase